jgi:hypothetical protein
MASSGAAIDLLSPTTIEDIEERTPAAEHTGDKRRLIGELEYDRLAGATTNARRAFSGPLSVVLRQSRNRTSTFGEEFARPDLFWEPLDRTTAEDLRDYSPTATVIFFVEGATRQQTSGHEHQLRALRRGLRNRLAHGLTSSFDELVAQVHGRVAARLHEPLSAFRSESALQSPETAADVERREDATVAELTTEMREMIDLPVQDLARMCGVQRRQFYNLMNGDSHPRNADHEQRLRQLHRILRDLFTALDENPEAVRAAVLTPLGDGLTTFFEVARGGDLALLGDAYRHVRARVVEGRLDRGALPPSGTLPPDAPEWQTAHEVVSSKGSQTIRGEDGGYPQGGR